MDINGAMKVFDGYLAEFHETPILKVWQPTDFDKKYYTGKKMERESAKRAEANKRDYDREMAWHERFMHALAKVKGVTPRLLTFFAETMESYVESNRRKRNEINRQIAAIRSRYDREVPFSYVDSSGMRNCWTFRPMEKRYDLTRQFWVGERKNTWTGRIEQEGHLEFTHGDGYFESQFDAFAPTEAEKVEFFNIMKQYDELRDSLNHIQTPGGVFHDLVERFGEIVKMIEKTLGGPAEDCSYDTDWGYGGHFNGIVTRGTQRASFKSFLAGGWNIQRLHVRFRVTLLND